MLPRFRAIGCVIALGVTFIGAIAGGQQTTVQKAATTADSVLTIDQAVAMALAHNRNVKIASMNVDASRQQFLAAKTKRLPSFSTYVFGAQTLGTLGYTIKKGQFGTYQATGPIPDHDTRISTSSAPTAFVVAQVSQPLVTLYKVNLNLRAQELAVQQTSEQSRGARQSISASVRQAYYGVVQAQQAVESIQAGIRQYEELDRITEKYVAEKVALKSDNLQVKAKLAQERLSLMQSQDKLQSGEETLNDLLGREIDTKFRTLPVAEPSPVEEDLQAAQAAALANNPEIRESELTAKQAEIQRRLAKAQFIPDINLSLRYISPFGISFLPSNLAAAGLEFSWEPYDWGRRGHTVKQKEIVLEQSKQQLEETKAQILINLDTQFRSLQEARAAISVAEANRASTGEKLRETTEQYAQKAALLRDVLEQQAANESANAQYNQAIAAFWSAKANFQKAIGEE